MLWSWTHHGMAALSALLALCGRIIYGFSSHMARAFRRLNPHVPSFECKGRYYSSHRPYSRQVTEWMECDVDIHPPPSVYPKAGNGALRGQWAIKYHCKNDSPTIVFTVHDLFHWNYVTSENIPRFCKSWKSLLIYVLATYIFLFIRHSLYCD